MSSTEAVGELEWLGGVWHFPREKESINLRHSDPMRRVSFAEVISSLKENGFLAVVEHKSRPNQQIIVVEINNYAYAVPVIWKDRFFKNVIPSRSLTKRYLLNKRGAK